MIYQHKTESETDLARDGDFTKAASFNWHWQSLLNRFRKAGRAHHKYQINLQYCPMCNCDCTIVIVRCKSLSTTSQRRDALKQNVGTSA